MAVRINARIDGCDDDGEADTYGDGGSNGENGKLF